MFPVMRLFISLSTFQTCLEWLGFGTLAILCFSFPLKKMKTYASIDELADEAGAGPDIRKYLHSRGIATVPTLALTAKTEEELEKVLLAPLFSGWSDGTVNIKIGTSEQPIAKAIVTHMWALARQFRNKTMTAAPAVPTPLIGSGTSPTLTTAASGSGAESKVPKTLPPGTWNSMVKHYQSIQLEGRDRTFPVTELIGAEAILARMHHELTVSGQFTPVMLGEILQKRSFNAAGEVNPLQKSPKKSSMLTFDEDNQLVTTEEPIWSPRSLLAIIDGVNSIRWAMILVRWGEERHVHSYADWMIAKARSQPQRGEQFVAYWQWAGWRMAMAMRNGSTFQESAEAIIGDVNKYNEIMAKEIIPDKKKANPADTPKGGKGKTQKGSKGKGSDQLWELALRSGPQHTIVQQNTCGITGTCLQSAATLCWHPLTWNQGSYKPCTSV